jgi:predicted DNA-binding protein with PD1-like motif
MHIIQSAHAFVIRLDPGEEVVTSLTEALRRSQIDGGVVTGIGAVVDTTLGYFDLHAKVYERRTFAEDMELVNLSGNIAWLDGQLFLHAHATISGRDFIAYAGHLFSATVSITGEFFIVPSGTTVHRVLDPRSGLKLMGS